MMQAPFGAMRIDSGGNILNYFPIGEIELDDVLGRNLIVIALALGLENPLDSPFDFEEFLMEGGERAFMLKDGVMLTLLRLEGETFALCKDMTIQDDEKEEADDMAELRELTKQAQDLVIGDLLAGLPNAPSEPQPEPKQKRQYRSESVRNIEEQLNALEPLFSINGSALWLKASTEPKEKPKEKPESNEEQGERPKTPPRMPPRFRREQVAQALIDGKGRVSQAARILGISHQGLNYMLKQGGYTDLAHLRAPAKPRKSIITKPQPVKKRGA